MPKRSAMFFDRDGVIVRDVEYLQRWEDIEFLPFAIEGLLELQQRWLLFIVTNQAAVARGFFSLGEAQVLNNEIVRRLRDAGVTIQQSYLCPHHPEFTGECDCRKPKIGMALQATQEFGVDLASSVFVGDKDGDIIFGRNCGGITVRIKNHQYDETVPADYSVAHLLELSEQISSRK